MSEHAAEHVHQSHGEAVAALPPGTDLRFEKTELEYFIQDDRHTGKNIGKLLALIFCVLVGMMAGVAWWTNRNHFVGQDPFEVPAASKTAGGH